jgi:hypothetical protein
MIVVEKALLAYKALFHVCRLDPNHPASHSMKVRFWYRYLATWQQSIKPVTKQVLDEAMKKNDGVASVEELNELNRAVLQRACSEGSVPLALSGTYIHVASSYDIVIQSL